MHLLLASLVLLHCTLAILSYTKVKNSKKLLTFIYWWATPLGAFVWEDLLVFSIYNVIVTIIVFLANDVRVGLLFIAVFWIIRSVGEALYHFLQQFLRPKHHPHDIHELFAPLKKVLGDISDQKCFIILQVYHQSTAVFATVGLILLLKNWHTLPSTF